MASIFEATVLRGCKDTDLFLRILNFCLADLVLNWAVDFLLFSIDVSNK